MTKMLRPLAASPPSRVREAFSRIFFPDAWVMNERYNPRFDHYLRTAINLGMVEGFRDPFLRVGGYSLWIRNYPYAYGTIHPIEYDVNLDGRPSFAVIRRLRKLEKQHSLRDAPPFPMI